MDFYFDEHQKNHHRKARISKQRKSHRKKRGNDSKRVHPDSETKGLRRSKGSTKSYAMSNKSSHNTIRRWKLDASFECPDISGCFDRFQFDQGISETTEEESASTITSDKISTLSSGIVPKKCPICLDIVVVVKLMRKCRHAAACRACLRELYICQAQKDVSNYPLVCFHPSCNRIVRDAQLLKLSLSTKQEEITRYHRLFTLAKAQANGRMVVHCPECDHPSFRRNPKKAEYIEMCKECDANFYVKSGYIFAMDKPDGNYFRKHNVCLCRRCGSSIEHTSGCYKMKCWCGYRFCIVCGSENAQCGHTPADHGFFDNVTCLPDFEGLKSKRSYT